MTAPRSANLAKKLGKGLAHTHGGAQADTGYTQTKHGKTHRDAVIVIGFSARVGRQDGQ
jgi:hypothetical protein